MAGGKRPLVVRVWRALTGADAREAAALAAEQERQRREKTLADLREIADRAGARERERTAREQQEQTRRVEELAVQKEVQAQRHAAAVERARALVADSPRMAEHPRALPVWQLITQTGGVFFVRPDDLADARQLGKRDVVLCDRAGRRLHELPEHAATDARRLVLRLSTIEASELSTVPAVNGAGQVIERPRLSQAAAEGSQRQGWGLSQRGDAGGYPPLPGSDQTPEDQEDQEQEERERGPRIRR